ncbi:flagellar hook-length control protein FliK [Limisalsivibrio acetivorans]|uniref:flagellar hook-length control protein FliK n=1 Tax=Limisalsivibrio acetivorans TaxID=1304888 RepID=UPI000401616A|nr:flagellar hook-length control protein FliK [Limisalsivibrio acetivorans]
MELLSMIGMMQQTSAAPGKDISAVPNDGPGAFEGMMKKYLNRTEAGNGQRDSGSEQSTQAETPEEVIDNLDIPEEQKAELKEALAGIDSEEEAAEFLEHLQEVLKMNGIGVQETMIKLAETLFVKNAEGFSNSAGNQQNKNLALAMQNSNVMEQMSTELTQEELEVLEAKLKELASQQNGEKKEQVFRFVRTEGTIEANMPGSDEKPKLTGFNDGSLFDQTIRGGEKQQIAKPTAIPQEIEVRNPKEILKIAEMIEVAKSQEAKKLSIQLVPKDLGRMNIELVDNSGKITAKVSFESQEAKALMSSHTDQIRQHLEEKGIILEKMEFLFADRDPREEFQQDSSNKKGSSSADAGGDTPEEDEEDDSSRGIYA